MQQTEAGQVLNISMDEIQEVIFTPTIRQRNNKEVDKEDHYLVDDHGTTVFIGEHKDALSCYTEIDKSNQKALIHVIHGIQHVEVTNAPLMYGLTEVLEGLRKLRQNAQY